MIPKQEQKNVSYPNRIKQHAFYKVLIIDTYISGIIVHKPVYGPYKSLENPGFEYGSVFDIKNNDIIYTLNCNAEEITLLSKLGMVAIWDSTYLKFIKLE